MAQVVIDTSLPAPRSTMHSLDFDRVVNAYSVMSVKKRLVNHHNQQQQQQRSSVQQRHASQQMKELVQSYRVFQSQAQSHHDHDNLLHSPNGKKYAQWGLTIALGLICGGVACLLIYCTSHITSFRTERLNWQLQLATGVLDEATFEERYHYKSFANKLAHYVGIPVATKYGTYAIMIEFTIYNAALALMSAFLCIFFAPNAVGSGIPEVKAYLNGVCVESFADLPVFLTKIVGTICSVSSGLIVGPEGPLVHIGAIVGQGITKTTSMEMALRRFRARRPNVAKLCGCGSADDGGLEEDVYMEEKYDKVLLAALAEGDSQDEEDDDDDDDFDDENGVSNEEDGLLSSLRLHDLEKVPDGRTYQSTGAYNRKQPRMDPPTQMQEETPTHCPKANHTFLTESMAVLSRFRNDGDRRDLISIGVATGFAAAFGAPVGGLLYSFEEASSFFTIPLMWRTLVATAIGTFVIAVYHGDLSQFSVLSLGDGSELAEYHHVFSSFAELPFYVLIGAAGGLLGAFFNACYIHNNTVRAKFYAHSDIRYKSFYRMLEVLIVSVLTSLATFCLSVYIPQSWACTDIKEGYGGDGDGESRYNCPVGQFNEIASILLGSRDDALNDILTDPSKFEPRTLLMTGLCCLFLMIITFGIFIPSGLFMPTLLTGSTLSGWAGLMLKRYVWSSIVPEHFALVGATAMLAGVQRTTVSLCVIMMEATGQTKVLIPLIIAVVVARYVADFFNDGFYHVSTPVNRMRRQFSTKSAHSHR
jgi:chloride channel 7